MMTENFSLVGKTALVTGGSRGIGAACAKLLAARGATLMMTYSKSADRAEAVVEEIAAKGSRAFAVEADAGDADAFKAGVALAINRLGGGLDILVNDAGIAEHGPLGMLTDAVFERHLDVNVRGVWQ